MSGPAVPRRLRLAFAVEHVHRRRGQERVVAELASRLSQRHEVHLYSYLAEDLPAAVMVHRLWCPSRSSTFNALAFVLLSAWALRGRRYDAVLAQGGNCLWPDFVLVHTCQAERARILAADPATRSLRHRLLLWRGRLVAALERRAVRRCAGRVIAVSPALARALREAYGLSEAALLVAPNGVDQELFNPETRAALRDGWRAELGLVPGEFVALFVGGIWEEKGLPLVLEALVRLDTPARLLVVGEGDVPSYQALAERRGVGERVRFFPPQAGIERFYAAADCLLLPSRSEGFSLVLAEAAACGLPLIATRVGIAEHLIEPGESGFLVTPDPEEIAAALATLVADPDRCERMGQAAHARALDLTWDHQAAAIEQFLLDQIAPA
jgi:glycosyltransferase involved in cell wall biosynthesis